MSATSSDKEAKEAVLAANQAFYDAFARRDAEALDALWARALPVACIHPGWTLLRGRARVIASFRGILAGGSSPKIVCADASAHLLGDVAFVTCYESIPGARLLATNIFAREEGAWRMVHHQAGPTARGAAKDVDDDEDEGDKKPGPDRRNLN